MEKQTKYIKVSVADRLPEKGKELFIVNSEEEIFHGYLSSSNNWIIYGLKNARNIQYFLEEVPDREHDLKELLREIYPLLMERHLYESGQKIQKILNEIYLTNQR